MSRVLLIALLVACCAAPRHERCCEDAVDCTFKDLPVDSVCGDGLVCGPEEDCIPDPCVGTTCDALAPYCAAMNECTDYCVRDRQCPGFAQPANYRFCVDGTCQECHAYTEDDCPPSKPFCDQGACRECETDFECGSGICRADGSCVPEDMIAYAAANGVDTSDCTRFSPCASVQRAATFQRPYVLVSGGTFTSDGAVVLNGQVLKASGAMPELRRWSPGPVIEVTGGHVVIENVRVFGAETGFNGELGDGVSCHAVGLTPTLELRGVEVQANRSNGLHAQSCDVTVLESGFFYNGRGFADSRLGSGVWIVGGSVTIDRSTLYANAAGLDLDSGRFSVTNTFITNSFGQGGGYGVEIDTVDAGSRFEHNTVADNGLDTMMGGAFNCNVQNATVAFPNNIIARNVIATTSANCTFPSSIIVDTDITSLAFKGVHDSMFDYHLTAGSSAIGAASSSVVDHDFDGDPRMSPTDVGADEFVP